MGNTSEPLATSIEEQQMKEDSGHGISAIAPSLEQRKEAVLRANVEGVPSVVASSAVAYAVTTANSTDTASSSIEITKKDSSVALLSIIDRANPTESVSSQIDSRHTPFSAQAATPNLFSLPVDSLHCISSFCTPKDWTQLSLVSRAAHQVTKPVFRKVRMHAFKCATEVVSAWKLGHRADARELAALYISRGVPIYPHCLGFSYHTVLWRMLTEAKQLAEEEDDHSSPDPFYDGYSEFRMNNAMFPAKLTHLETKTLFWLSKETDNDPEAQALRAAVGRGKSPMFALVESRAVSACGSDGEGISKKLPLSIHRHLLDQHSLGTEAVETANGFASTPHMSLSADFFHDQSELRESKSSCINNFRPAGVLEGVNSPYSRVLLRPRHPPRVPVDDDLFEPYSQHHNPFQEFPIMDFLDLNVYSGSSPTKESEAGSTHQLLQARFETFRMRLEGMLSRGEHSQFDEYLLDFWDACFPHTAGFHYHDRRTAIPRISCLNEFLAKPCPKAVGIVQCEIERIKTTTRGKGVSMAGRLFPTYEYRLFIRNHQIDASPEVTVAGGETNENAAVRRDTLLMVAKNRGRKRYDSHAKKGSNNFLLYTASQRDVDSHYSKVNSVTTTKAPNGACYDSRVINGSEGSSSILARLQSNFIGTEFQIFVPRFREIGNTKRRIDLSFEEEGGYDSGTSSEFDNTSSRRSRFSRLGLRRSNEPLAPTSPRSRGFFRSSSNPDRLSRPGRSNRRAIANTPDQVVPQPKVEQEESDNTGSGKGMFEEEDGVITYTANLLGSRPRIMDVCLPKVDDNGTIGAEWKTFMDNLLQDEDDADMLTSFRQLVHRIETQDEEEEETSDRIDDFGLLVLQNRPPWWNMELGSFVLNFGGRVSVASVKNFQLCERTDQDKILLQFGRIQGRHSFTMDFQYPLTAVQAFSIAISSLQSKISFG